jgi:hypothetical protein
LIVEFIPLTDAALSKSLAGRSPEFMGRFEWYSIENFRAKLAEYFTDIRELPSFPEPRVLIHARRRLADPALT